MESKWTRIYIYIYIYIYICVCAEGWSKFNELNEVDEAFLIGAAMLLAFTQEKQSPLLFFVRLLSRAFVSIAAHGERDMYICWRIDRLFAC